MSVTTEVRKARYATTAAERLVLVTLDARAYDYALYDGVLADDSTWMEVGRLTWDRDLKGYRGTWNLLPNVDEEYSEIVGTKLDDSARTLRRLATTPDLHRASGMAAADDPVEPGVTPLTGTEAVAVITDEVKKAKRSAAAKKAAATRAAKKAAQQ